MEQFIQTIVVISFSIMGASMLLKPSIWVGWVKDLESRGASAVMSLGMINLLLGSIIVASHWVWEGFAMIITIIGLIMLCRSFFMLFLPNLVLKMIATMTPKMTFIMPFAGILILVMAGTIFYQLDV